MLLRFRRFVKSFARTSHRLSDLPVAPVSVSSGIDAREPFAFTFGSALLSAGGGPLDVPGRDASGVPGGGPSPA